MALEIIGRNNPVVKRMKARNAATQKLREKKEVPDIHCN